MTNKIRLIKSFANYPVGEYTLSKDCYCMSQNDNPPWFTKIIYIHKDIVEWMADYFEEVKEPIRKGYYYIGDDWRVWTVVWCEDEDLNNLRQKCWNYYDSYQWAQAVADLRKHVYKFPMCKKWDKTFAVSRDCFGDAREMVRTGYNPLCIHISSTEADRAERLHLIEQCIKYNWYLTI